jgi:hypothetical protein
MDPAKPLTVENPISTTPKANANVVVLSATVVSMVLASAPNAPKTQLQKIKRNANALRVSVSKTAVARKTLLILAAPTSTTSGAMRRALVSVRRDTARMNSDIALLYLANLMNLLQAIPAKPVVRTALTVRTSLDIACSAKIHLS